MKGPGWLLVLLLIVAGCSRPPTLDATSMKTLDASTARMAAALTEAQKQQMAVDLFVLSDPADPIPWRRLHGMTAAAIHAEAEKARAAGASPFAPRR